MLVWILFLLNVEDAGGAFRPSPTAVISLIKLYGAGPRPPPAG